MSRRPLVPAILFLYVVSHALDSPLRWSLSSVGLAPLIYIRDLGLIAVIGLALSFDIQQRRHCVPKIALLGVTMGYGLIAIYNGLPAGQMLFGFKVWLPFLAAYCALDSGMMDAGDWRKPAMALLLITVAGLALNYFWRPPWTGMTIEVAGADVVGNREWTTYGVRRLSGFARSSYDAAMLLLLLGVYLLSALRSITSQFWVTILVGVGIGLTTSKGALGSFLIIAMVLPLFWSGEQHDSRRTWLIRSLVMLFGGLGLLAPLWSISSIAPQFQTGSVEQKILASLVARGWETWPQAFSLLSEGQWIVGRGLGGIGVAQSLFEPSRANPADNFGVYLIVTAGIVGVAFYFYLMTWALPKETTTTEGRLRAMTLLVIFGYGVTASIIENALFALALGLVLRAAQRGHPVEHIASAPVGESAGPRRPVAVP